MYAAVTLTHSEGNTITDATIITNPAADIAIPRRSFALDMSKVAAAQQQANSIRAELAQPIVLDMAKVAQAQETARWIMQKFGK